MIKTVSGSAAGDNTCGTRVKSRKKTARTDKEKSTLSDPARSALLERPVCRLLFGRCLVTGQSAEVELLENRYRTARDTTTPGAVYCRVAWSFSGRYRGRIRVRCHVARGRTQSSFYPRPFSHPPAGAVFLTSYRCVTNSYDVSAPSEKKKGKKF